MSLNRVLEFVSYVLAIVITVLCLSLTSTLAQDATGTILGTVADPEGAVVPGAVVTATNTATSFTRTVPTGEDGAYRLPSLPVGNYEIRVTKEGFQTNERRGLTVDVAQEAVVNFTMAVGATTQTVEVTEQAPLIDTTTASVGSVVDEQRVADLPLNGRNWSNLTLMQAGVAQSFLLAPSPTGSSGGFPTAGNIFVSNGAPTRSNNYMLDGAILQTINGFNGASVSGNSLGIDGIQEYKVITSLFSAEYPLTMGSQTIIASKSGTNAFHGDGFEYLRNSALDARNYFDLLDSTNARGFGTDKSTAWPDKRLPPFRRSNFGGSIGGPIQKDKTFFYAVYEGLHEDKGLSTVANTLPAGCFNSAGTFFGAISPSLPTSCVVSSTGGSVAMAPAIQEVLTQSNSGGPLNSTIFPSGGIFPAPNVVGGKGFNFSYPVVQFTDENYGQMRLDHNFSAGDSAFIRYTQDQTSQVIPGAYPSEQTTQDSVDQYTTVSESHVFSPNLIQTLRFSFSRTLTVVSPNSEVPGANEKSLVYQRSMGAFSPGTGSNGTVTAFGVVQPATYYQKIFTSSDDYIWTRGKHSLKIGALWNHWSNPNSGVEFQSQGSLSFSSLGQMLAGQYTSISYEPATTNLQKSISYDTVGFYVQDDYRVHPRLTLNLGLRYEFATDPDGPDTYAIRNQLTAVPPIFGTPGPMLSTAASRHAFSPRLGFAWDVRGNGKTAVRGGGGIYYDIGILGQMVLQTNYDALPHTWQYVFTNFSTNPLTATPVGEGILDPLSSERNGCGQIVVPTYAPCPAASVQYNADQPSMGQWNLTIDQQLPWSMALSVSYIGSAGWHLWSQEDINYVNATIAADGSYIPLQTDSRGEPSYCVRAANGACAFSENPAVTSTAAGNAINNLAFQRLNPYLGAANYSLTDGRSWYHSLQVVLNKRLSHGLQFQSAFTWAKNMDEGGTEVTADGANTIVVPNGPNGNNVDKIDDAPSAYDIGTNWRFNAIYHFTDIQSDALWAKPLKGWWTGAIFAMQSGYPFTPSIGGGSRIIATPGIGTDVPDRATSFNPNTVIVGKPTEWFDPTQFALQPAGIDGNEGRNFLFGPPLANLDWSFNKDTKAPFLGESGSIEFRAEIFNILNHANFALPNTAVYNLPAGALAGSTLPGQFGSTSALAPNASAGVITSTVTPSRQIQFALKIVF